jgi:hypothetical protein
MEWGQVNAGVACLFFLLIAIWLITENIMSQIRNPELDDRDLSNNPILKSFAARDKGQSANYWEVYGNQTEDEDADDETEELSVWEE